MLKKTIGLAFFSLLLCNSVSAAEKDENVKPLKQESSVNKTFTEVFMLPGLNLVDISALNTSLAAAGYSRFSEYQFSFGGGMQLAFNNVIYGIEGQALFGRELDNVNTKYKVSSSSGYGGVNVGYLLISNDMFKVYPSIFAGVGSIDVKITQPTVSSFNDSLTNPPARATFLTVSPVIGISLTGEYLLNFANNVVAKDGVAIGLSLGYNYAPVKEWEINGTRISGGPQASTTGPFIRLKIGKYSETISEKE